MDNIWKDEWNQLNTQAQDWMETGITPTECPTREANLEDPQQTTSGTGEVQSTYESIGPPDRREMQL